jgi:hypothetical protein
LGYLGVGTYGAASMGDGRGRCHTQMAEEGGGATMANSKHDSEELK